jgi:hypothetical protein
MIFSRNKSAIKKLRLEFEEKASKNRTAIEGKLKEASEIDGQLANIILDTKNLTTSIQEKLSTRLKITPKTIKTIVTDIREGVVIVNYVGDIIETNKAFEDLFLENIIGLNFSDLCEKLNCVKDKERFEINADFRDLSKRIFESKKQLKIQTEIPIIVNLSGKKPLKCVFSMKSLDNDPEHIRDVCFIAFFKGERRKNRSNQVSV